MMERLLGTILAIEWVLAAAFWFRGAYAMFMAAAHRKPAVGYLTAMNGVYLIFRDSLYTDEGRKWATTYGRCMLGFVLTVAPALVSAKVAGYP